MNQPITLDLTGGWERIVNNVERHNAKVRFREKLYRRKLTKKISTIVEIVLVAALVIALDLCGLLTPWVAGLIATVLICIACFLGGRVYEGYRK